jgi:hypothetical protein
VRVLYARVALGLLLSILISALFGDFPVAAATDEQAVLQADRNFVSAAARTDKAATAAFLDEQFEWTDAEGKTRSKAEVLHDLPALAADSQGEADVKTYPYGQVEVITGTHHAGTRDDRRFMRVWVKRPAGWQAFGILDTTIAGGAAPFSNTAPGAGDCENPCRTIPYKPTTATDEAIVAILQRLKMDEWQPNPDDWAHYVIDDVNYVTSAASLSKADRVARLAQQKQSGGAIVPGDPVMAMRMFDFGDAAIMITRNAPYRGGKPYYSLRVWTFRDARWQLANSQQTVIASAAALPPVTSQK